MRLQPIISMLQAATAKRVLSALHFSADFSAQQFVGEYYVFPLRDRPKDNHLVNAHSQTVQHVFAVVSCVRSVNTPGAGDTSDALEDARDAVKSALVGYTPANATDTVSYAGGALLDIKSGTVLWQDEFATTSRIRRVT